MTGLHADLTVPGRLVAQVHAAPGRVVAVIGPNGAGKSTLLGALAGTVAATGRVEVGGRDWTDLPVRERRLGVVFQDRSLFPHLRAHEDVAFGLRTRGVPRRDAERRARDWLDRLGVGDLAERRPAELSGGQAQRVAIARALATEPDLLLLDEPFAGLDVGVATGLRIELARHLAAYAGVVLLVTHDALDALTLADEVLVLDEGRVVQTGSPREVAAHPRTEHVARLVGLNVVREGETLRSFAPSAVTVSPRGAGSGPAPTSARNRWAGRVAALAPHGDAVRLLVTTTRGPELIADVTPAAAVELGLDPGAEVWLSVKETAVQTDSMRP
ncbi:Putative 2-aminoethylphosphonate import ATP-binding protein PhnT [Nocardioides dokdonensis FR1436]|uniref:Putative 2-aminoethylphosphonate import ATP-binding protein PhnT n=1 Tax=Nocardioides dokdonensis FR1436 TaxID=1300347 RepID=A0A1A9GJM4_9ACTN|nr:ABC transporter ATP-binding protein [Nocardioides dokdonensis]ANH38489.1 Putative 2-aminoethylphosphonate import ATP-binding protein PhnT [Nocardioides dokdonensis FR1436]